MEGRREATKSMHPSFDLTNRIAVITGGIGLLGRQHAHAIARSGGVPVLLDLEVARPREVAEELSREWNTPVHGYACDITNETSVGETHLRVAREVGAVDILITTPPTTPSRNPAPIRNLLAWKICRSMPGTPTSPSA